MATMKQARKDFANRTHVIRTVHDKNGAGVDVKVRKRNPKGVNSQSATAAFPPIKVLLEWVQRHYKSFAPGGRTRGGRARARSSKRGEAGRKARQQYDRRLYQLAFLVGRKIRDYGIPPTPFMLPAFRKQAPLLSKRINFWIKRLSP